MFCKIAVLKNFADFTGKYLCWSIFPIKLQASCNFIETILQRRSFPVKFARFLGTLFFNNTTPAAASEAERSAFNFVCYFDKTREKGMVQDKKILLKTSR